MTGNNQVTGKTFFKKKSIVIGVLSAIILIGLGVGVYVYFVQQSSDNTTTESTTGSDVKPFAQRPSDQSSRSAARALADGDIDSAANTYKEKADSASDNSTQASYLVDAAMAYINGGRYSDALPLALKARELTGDTVQSASLLGMIYENADDKPHAIEQYKKAAELFKKDADPMARAAYYEQKVRELES